MGKVYIYKEYNDKDFYGEEHIEVFASREKAIARLKKRVEETYLNNEISFDVFMNNSVEKWKRCYQYRLFDDVVEEDEVCLDDGSGNTLFYIVEEHDVIE